MAFWLMQLGLTVAALLMPIACVTTPAPTNTQLQEALTGHGVIAKPFIWRIERQDKSCFLLGTMHMGVDAKVELPQEVWRAFESAAHFVAESDSRNRSASLPSLPPGLDRLSLNLSDTAWSNLQAALAPMTDDELDRLTPGMAAVLYQFKLLARQMPANVQAMDRQMISAAELHEKSLSFLESVADANAALDQTVASIAELEALLIRDENEFASELVNQFMELLREYRSGDLHQIEDATINQLGSRNYETLIARRNHAWLSTLEPILSAGNCFVAVGIGHMIGADSLLLILQEKGYVVSRI